MRQCEAMEETSKPVFSISTQVQVDWNLILLICKLGSMLTISIGERSPKDGGRWNVCIWWGGQTSNLL